VGRPLAVVLGLGVNGLGVARSLGRAGIPTLGLWSEDDQAGRVSRYCRAVRAPSTPSDETLSVLLHAIGEPEDKPVLFPTSDAYAHWISERQDVLRGSFRFHTVAPALFEGLNSKIGSVRLAAEHGIDTPRTASFDRLPSFERGIGALSLPIVVKPIDTFRRTLPRGAKNELFRARDALDAYVRSFARFLPDMVFQEVVPSGDGHIHVCTLLLDAAGEPLLRYTGRKIRQYRPDFGVTSFGVSEWNGELADLSARFMRAAGYRGLCTLEFARDRRSGRYLFLEANLRSYYHNQLFTDSGVNFALAEYGALTGAAPPGHMPQRDGIHWLDFPRDLGSYYRRRSELRLREWLGSLLEARSFASFALDDPLPCLYEMSQLVLRVLRRGMRRKESDAFQASIST
jgi:predicted ATP-grasp superfamily ATP-dependent carboligase